jgi:C_GCAxxG_C_C family probable redox protein
MTKPDDAAAYFNEGFSSSQAVISVFSEDLGLELETARKISCGFGAGMGRTDNICGAVTGAMMVIGMKYGKAQAGDDTAKEKTYALVQEFLKQFKEQHGSISCTELLGYNLRDPGQRRQAHESDTVATKCPEFARNAVTILEKLSDETR